MNETSQNTLTSYTLSELSELLAGWNEPKFRARQVFEGIQKGKRPDDMSNIPALLREKLNLLPFGGVDISHTLVSQKDGTKKFLFTLEDNNIIEGVLMRYKYGNTLCISSQVGCNMGCAFCASTLNGCVRNLSAGEMLSEVLSVEKHMQSENVSGNDNAIADSDSDFDSDPQKAATPAFKSGRAVTNIVMMGSGEPLDNYDNTIRFLDLVSCKDGINISPRNISLSTCGLVDKIIRLINDGIHVTLSISLHAPNDTIRSELMPINKVYGVSDVISAANEYAERTGRRVIFEYALIKDVNDGTEHAQELSRKLRGINCHVNLIPLNTVKERNLTGVSRNAASDFCQMLNSLHISSTVRRQMGADIDGACGQLRRRYLEQGGL